MSTKKSNGSRKDPLKTPKVWERARREKMKIYFNELQEVLPFYDPSAPMSRFEILQKSRIYIKDLQDQNQDLLNGGFDEVYKVKMMKLKQRVKELLKRVDQLTDLLRTANIMIPPLEAYPEGIKTLSSFKWMSQHPKKWTEKINLVVPDDKIKNVLTLIKDCKKNSKVKLKKRGLDKATDKSESTTKESKIVTKKKRSLKSGSKVINLKPTKVNKETTLRSSSPSQFKENQPVDFNSITNDGGKKTELDKSDATKCTTTTTTTTTTTPTCQVTSSATISKIIPQNVILPSAPSILQSNTFILTNDGSLVQLPVLNQTGTVLSNSNILTQGAIVKPNAGLLTPVVINKPSPVIVLQKPAPIIKTQVINPTPQVVVSKPSVQILGTNIYGTKLPHILAKTPANKKRIARDSTVTTYVNKIPIPALSKQSYAKKTVVSKKEKTKEVEKQPENANENDEKQVEKELEKEKTTEMGEKRSVLDEENTAQKKQKQNENVFKPIENENGVYCNLELPNPMNPSVSPTAAFLSSFPIVAPTRSEAEDDPKTDDKDPKTDAQVDNVKESANVVKGTMENTKEVPQDKEKPDEPKETQTTQLDLCKSWEQFQNTENFYIPSDNVTPLENITPGSYSNTNLNLQSNQNEQVKNKSYNQFEYVQKESYLNKLPAYSKPCTNMADMYNKNYQIDPTPNYQLIPVKERNQRTVNWMTEPDVSNRVAYLPQNDKITKTYPQSDTFFNNQPPKGDYFVEQKTHYQYGKDQRCKIVDRRTDKCYAKTGQNCNIFDYNYPGGCYGDDSNKYCQTYGKGKKVPQKKKELDDQTDQKRSEQSIIDFNPANQECFTWVPGKNVDWMPGKSFSLDSNLVVPSTLPTLMGDLALGTSTDTAQKNTKHCQKDDFGMGKPLEADAGKYFEPFANLSKNIFDVTNVNNQTTNFNNNETIVLKNIFELPVSKSSEFSRKQRALNNQNTFLSVSQLVEPPTFDGLKNDQLDVSKTTTDGYYPNYNQKTYKKPRNCKYDRKYHGYKNASTSYTAEALIRNTNAGYQPNEYSTDGNFFNGKPNQKMEQFAPNVEVNVKSDFSAGQNLYSDFNFSSPVPNFTIGSSVSTDFATHDTSGNFTSQNSTFFGDFITPEYPLSDNVSNSLLLPPCSIALQNPFVIDKRNSEKTKNTKPYSRSRKHFDCAKTTYNDFSLTPTTAIFTTAAITCPTIFTTSQNLLPVPTQTIPITFSSSSFSTTNISFPALSSASNNNYHRFPATTQNALLPSNPMFTTCTSKPLTSQNCYSSTSLTSVANSVISSFPVANASLCTSQSTIPFLSLSNPIIHSSAPTSSSNSLANFNLSTIFPEINQKGNYHYS